MRTILSLALGMVLVTGALAQEVDVCGEVYAPWGSSTADVIRAGTKANLNFKEVTKQDAQGITQVTFVNGSIARVFTMLKGRYVSFNLLHMDKDEYKRNKYTSNQMLNVMSQDAKLNNDAGWMITCGESTLKATMETKSDQASFFLMSLTAIKGVVQSGD
jgi:hypothetical protein